MWFGSSKNIPRTDQNETSARNFFAKNQKFVKFHFVCE